MTPAHIEQDAAFAAEFKALYARYEVWVAGLRAHFDPLGTDDPAVRRAYAAAAQAAWDTYLRLEWEIRQRQRAARTALDDAHYSSARTLAEGGKP